MRRTPTGKTEDGKQACNAIARVGLVRVVCCVFRKRERECVCVNSNEGASNSFTKSKQNIQFTNYSTPVCVCGFWFFCPETRLCTWLLGRWGFKLLEWPVVCYCSRCHKLHVGEKLFPIHFSLTCVCFSPSVVFLSCFFFFSLRTQERKRSSEVIETLLKNGANTNSVNTKVIFTVQCVFLHLFFQPFPLQYCWRFFGVVFIMSSLYVLVVHQGHCHHHHQH